VYVCSDFSAGIVGPRFTVTIQDPTSLVELLVELAALGVRSADAEMPPIAVAVSTISVIAPSAVLSLLDELLAGLALTASNMALILPPRTEWWAPAEPAGRGAYTELERASDSDAQQREHIALVDLWVKYGDG